MNYYFLRYIHEDNPGEITLYFDNMAKAQIFLNEMKKDSKVHQAYLYEAHRVDQK